MLLEGFLRTHDPPTFTDGADHCTLERKPGAVHLKDTSPRPEHAAKLAFHWRVECTTKHLTGPPCCVGLGL